MEIEIEIEIELKSGFWHPRTTGTWVASSVAWRVA